VVSSHLIQLGQQAVADVTVNVAKGEPLVRCQLLASTVIPRRRSPKLQAESACSRRQ
jgi:hypothetical protein